MYITTVRKINRNFNWINREVFNNELYNFRCVSTYKYEKSGHWAICLGSTCVDKGEKFCNLKIAEEFPNRQIFLNILAHEIIHLYQWTVLGHMNHGPTFHEWANIFDERGIEILEEV